MGDAHTFDRVPAGTSRRVIEVGAGTRRRRPPTGKAVAFIVSARRREAGSQPSGAVRSPTAGAPAPPDPAVHHGGASGTGERPRARGPRRDLRLRRSGRAA